jgi:hypothetical protein
LKIRVLSRKAACSTSGDMFTVPQLALQAWADWQGKVLAWIGANSDVSRRTQCTSLGLLQPPSGPLELLDLAVFSGFASSNRGKSTFPPTVTGSPSCLPSTISGQFYGRAPNFLGF